MIKNSLSKRGAFIAVFAGALLVPTLASGNVKIEGKDGSFINLSTRLQMRYADTDSDLITNAEDFRLQRARIQMFAHITKTLNLFMQTESSDATGGSGSDLRLMSAWFLYKPIDEFQLIIGQHITGAGGRNGFASSGTYLAMDLYNIAFKGMNLGTRASGGQFTTIIPETDAGLRTEAVPRDRGITLYGDHSFTDKIHVKYYGSINDGAESAIGFSGNTRQGGRVQVNFGDQEKGIFPKGTYLGKINTIGIAGSFDTQSEVAEDIVTGQIVDYNFWSVDGFLERNIGPGTLNIEAAYMNLDLDSAPNQLTVAGGIVPLGSASGEQAQGAGYYASVGYLMGSVQPWFAYEQWESDDPTGVGSFDGFRLGLNYYVSDNYDFVLKAGYSVDNLDWTPGAGTEDQIRTVTIGIYTDF